jgi:hypothetical protein
MGSTAAAMVRRRRSNSIGIDIDGDIEVAW